MKRNITKEFRLSQSICFIISTMAYSIHVHVSYIWEASSKRPRDFSFIGRKLNEILQFKWERLMVLKFKPKLNLKFRLKESKTKKIKKGSKNRRRLTQVKAIIFYKQYRDILWQQENPRQKNGFWLCCTFWASY